MDEHALRNTLMSVRQAIRRVSVTAADDKAIATQLNGGAGAAGRGFIATAVGTGVALTPGFWARYLELMIATWDQGGKKHALWLPELRQLHAPSDDGSSLEDQILDPSARILQDLASPHDDDTDEDLGNDLQALALAVEKAGDPDNAYNLAACALVLGPPPGPQRKAVAEYALSLAVAADRPHQMAVCAGEIAASVAAMGDETTESRLATFTAFEIAVERLARAPREVATVVAANLVAVMRSRPWLLHLGAPLVPLVGDASTRKGLADMLGREGWPDRISAGPLDGWAAGMKALFQAMVVEIEIEEDRLALEPQPSRDGAEADWVSWTLHHPSYARAVPHHRSFLRERDFDRNLLVLTHEVTHVLSFIGVIGSALTVLRVAALDNELTIWSVVEGVDVETIRDRVGESGLAPLVDGDGASLFRAELGVELTLKAQALQDAWTPWFEGLAIFSEIAADPALDPTAIGPVTEVLRNLVDFHPEPGKTGIYDDKDAIRRQYLAFAAEFEERCSRAIAAAGPERLYRYLIDAKQPYYLAGYLAVRMVVAAWRRATGRPLHGAEVFTLLLHATRYGTREAIPDLSLPGDAFAAEAVRRMAKWATDLAALPAAAIEEFLAAPRRSEAGRAYVWRGGALVAVEWDAPGLRAEQEAHLLQLVRQALATLADHRDAERVADASPLCRDLVAHCAGTVAGYNATPDGEANIARNVELAQTYFNLGALLPIGHAAAKFWLNNDDAAGTSYLMTQLRTAEAHQDTGRPSMNGFGFQIDRERGRELAEHYRRTGTPRLQVVRLIDLGAFVHAQPGLHFLALGDERGCLWLQGASQATDTILRRDAGRLQWLTALAGRRLWPPPAIRAELEVIARGDAGATRTRDWIAAATRWQIGGEEAPVEPWARHVRARAERALDSGLRAGAQREASRVLLGALSGDQALAGNILAKGLHGLTRKIAAERFAIAEALFRTARVPGTDAWLETGAATVAAGGLPIFSKTGLGWDVRPAGPNP